MPLCKDNTIIFIHLLQYFTYICIKAQFSFVCDQNKTKDAISFTFWLLTSSQKEVNDTNGHIATLGNEISWHLHLQQEFTYELANLQSYLLRESTTFQNVIRTYSIQKHQSWQDSEKRWMFLSESTWADAFNKASLLLSPVSSLLMSSFTWEQTGECWRGILW